MKLTIRDITIIPILAVILFVQEQLFSLLPNIQLTVLLIFVYSKTQGLFKTILIVIIHVILDNLYMGSLNFLYTPAMLVGWMIIPICMCTIFKKIENIYIIAGLGVIFSLFYCWVFIIPQYIMYKIDIIAYLTADIIFELIMCGSSFISIIWLYKPLNNILYNLENQNLEV